MVLSCGLTLIRVSVSVTCWVVFSKCLVSRSRPSSSAGSSILRYLMPIGEILNPWDAFLDKRKHLRSCYELSGWALPYPRILLWLYLLLNQSDSFRCPDM